MSTAWMRYGRPGSMIHAAHLFVDGAQACKTAHGLRLAPPAHRASFTEPHEVETTAHGAPYGRTCQYCLRVWHRLKRDDDGRKAAG